MKLKINNSTGLTKFTEDAFLNEYLGKFVDSPQTYELLKNPCHEHSPKLLHDGEAVADYLINTDKYIVVCGDFDCDGIMATSILVNTLRTLNKFVDYVIPDRMIDGYGLNSNMVKDIASRLDPKNTVLLTCDNGIACHEAIDTAKGLGMDVIVTDHHSIGESLPDADYIVHPALGNYPYKEISGATVAYKLAQLIIEKGSINNPQLETANKQFATITVISDVMPVASYDYATMSVNENRRLLMEGIESIRTNPDWHLAMMAQLCGFDLETLDETTIGFNIAPVLNASGRIAKANYAVDFFITTEDVKEYAKIKCSFIVYLNNERKQMKVTQLQEAEKVLTGNSIKLAFNKELHKGMVGIVAGQISESYKIPAGIFTETAKDGKKVWTGSMRSNTVHLFNALTEISKECPILGFGGHAGAAGITIADEDVDKFKKVAEKYFTENACKPVDYSIALKDYQEVMDKGLLIKDLKPFGNGLPKPQVRFNFFCTQVDIYYKSGHCKLSNYKQEELWLFSKKDEMLKHPVLKTLPMKSDNTEKLKEAGESIENRWERYSEYKKYYNFNIEAEIDYSSFAGVVNTQISVKKF